MFRQYGRVASGRPAFPCIGIIAGIFGTALLLLAGCGGSADPTERAQEDHSGHADSAGRSPADSHAGIESSGEVCPLHKAPAEMCFICDASLRDSQRLWCNEHGRYEDRCWICHPELRDAQRPYCDEHGLYEDECFYCDPARARSAADSAAADSHGQGLFCAEHGVPEAECGICRPEVISQLPAGGSLKVRLPSVDSARGSGVETGVASVGRISDGFDCYAELAFDQNKLAQIVAPVRGIVEEVPVDLGSRVAPNQTVARLWSAEITEAVAKAVLLHQTLDRERRLFEQRVTSQQELQEAEAAHRAACQQLRTYGFTEEGIEALSHNPDESVLLDVLAPFGGEIIERLAVRGELVETGRHLFTLGDRSVMWAMLNIPEAHLVRVQLGQTVELRFDSIPGATFSGRLTWVSARVDERTRMIQARAEVPNPERILRAGMFANARVITRSPDEALLLPSSAVQEVEGRSLVFVKLEDDLFEARRVDLGASAEGRVEVLAGLSPGEVLAVNHVFPLKAQLLLSRLGAGCAHE